MTTLADIPHFFPANWEDEVVVTSDYQTRIDTSQTDVESRRILAERPVRTIKVKMSAIGYDGYDPERLQKNLREAAQSRVLVPLWSDFCRLTAEAVSATVLSTTSTLNRRYYAGQKVFIAFPVNRTRWQYDIAVVESVSANSITVEDAVSWPEGSRIFPAIRAEVVLNSHMEAMTRHQSEMSVTFKEVYSTETLPPSVSIGTLPSGEPTFASLPVFTIPLDWRSVTPGIQRQGSLALVGLENIPDLFGSGRYNFSSGFRGLTRDRATRLTRFFDSRGGRAFPFWLPEQIPNAQVTAVTTTTVTVDASVTSYAEAQGRIGKHLGLVRSDSSISVHRVSSVTDLGATVRFNLATSINLSQFGLGLFQRVSWVHLVRFDSDGIQESWITDEAMTSKLSAVQLRNSGDAEYVGVIPEVPDPRTNVTPPEPWEPDRNCSEESGVPIPMFFAPCASAARDRDPSRPVIRAADFMMPKGIRVNLSRILRDTVHAGPELIEAIRRLKTTFKLEYEPLLDSEDSVSRHWHHTRVAGTFTTEWTYDYYQIADLSVKRRVWRGFAQYRFEDVVYNIELRMSVEWANTYNEGLWGAAVNFYAFTDQVAYVDGTPTDVYGPTLAFTRNDPAVGVGASKYCHPQMLLCGSVPTTYESACLRTWFDPDLTDSELPLEDEFTVHSSRKEFCFKLPNGSPWEISDPGCLWQRPMSDDQRHRVNFVGSAGLSTDNNGVMLTKSLSGWDFNGTTVGALSAVWYRPTKLQFDDDWQVSFKYRFKDIESGGSGFALAFQNISPRELGGRDADLGYDGITNVFAVEFDLAGGHISVQSGGAGGGNSIGSVALVADEVEHDVTVVHDLSEETLVVSVDGEVVLTVDPFDFADHLGGSTQAWVGFTGTTTPTEYQTTEVYELDLHATYALGDPESALLNSVFGNTDIGFGAMTLGGDCPTSALFEWLFIESQPGITLLTVESPGWDRFTCSLVWESPSVTLEFCTASQEDQVISCCEGHSAWTAYTEGTYSCIGLSDNECCFKIESNVEFPLTGVKVCLYDCFDEMGAPVTAPVDAVCGSITTDYLLHMHRVEYAQGGDPETRSASWRCRHHDPDYVSNSLTTDFLVPGLADFTVRNGAWTNSGGAVRTTDADINVLTSDLGTDPNIRDGQVEVEIHDVLSGDLGAAARHDGDIGIVGLISPEFRTLTLRYYTSAGVWQTVGVKGFLNVVPQAGDHIKLRVIGSYWRLERNASDVLFEKFCADIPGGFGLWGQGAGRVFDNVIITDLSATLLESEVSFTHAGGWSFNINERTTDWYLEEGVMTGCGEPPVAESCCSTTTVFYSLLSGNESSTSITTGTNPPELSPCTENFVLVQLQNIGTATVVSLCDEDPTADLSCSSFSVWIKVCAAEP